MGPDGVVGPFPALQRLIQRRDRQLGVTHLVELLRVRALRALDAAVELGRAGWQDEQPQPAIPTGRLEVRRELAAPIDLQAL